MLMFFILFMAVFCTATMATFVIMTMAVAMTVTVTMTMVMIMISSQMIVAVSRMQNFHLNQIKTQT